jgi:hypothetical protein
MTAPVRRRPGRPRKNPLPEDVVSTPSTEEVGRGDPPESTEDPRIGQECHPGATQVGFDDGSVYRADGGYLVERLGG